MAVIETGNDQVGKVNVNSNFQLEVHQPSTESQAGFGLVTTSLDAGAMTGTRYNISPEADTDHRLRVGQDQLLDVELFNYVAQNTGKHFFAFTTLTATVSANGLLLNSGAITTASTGCTFGTQAQFLFVGTAPLFCEMSVSFNAQPVSNVTFDFGLFQRGAANPFAPLDGVYFRLDSGGLQGVVNNNGIETTTSVFPLSGGTGTFVYVNDSVNRYSIQISNMITTFWINDVLAGSIINPVAQSQPFRSAAVPFSVRYAISAGGAGAGLQARLWDYRVGFRGPAVAENLGAVGNRVFGSYQGLSGNTVGTLGQYTNNTNPAAAVPTNTTAALGAGLGGNFLETFSLALTVDGIISSFQVPAGSTTVQGRRLRVHGVRIKSFVSTVLAGGPSNAIWTLNFGHTAVSLATAESASFATGTTKAPRRIAIGVQSIVANQAVNTTMETIDANFIEPIYVNPGEFIATAKKYVGTVGTSGVITHVIHFDFGWE